MGDLGNKLQKAIEDKRNDINSYVWRLQNGKEVKLVDCSEEDLNKFYKHCNEMLYNESVNAPGKLTIRKNISRIYLNCNAELFVRWLLKECETGLGSSKDILDYINVMRENNSNFDIQHDTIVKLFTNVPIVYQNITISKLMDACFDRLDVINKKMISDKFILSQGIWLTEAEKQDLTEYDENGKVRPWSEVIIERLCLNPEIKLYAKPSGLSYTEFRALVTMPSLPKISSLPTSTLKALRDKVLLLLDNDLNYHIEKWEDLINKIQIVAKTKNITLKE